MAENDSDVRLKTENENMAFSCMRNEKYALNRYYKNSSVIVDLAMGHIPRSTEHNMFCVTRYLPLAANDALITNNFMCHQPSEQ